MTFEQTIGLVIIVCGISIIVGIIMTEKNEKH